MIRFRIPRPNWNAILRRFAYLVIVGLFAVVGYMFWMIRADFDRMSGTLRGLFP